MHWDRDKLVRAAGKVPGEMQFLCVCMVGYASFCHQFKKGK